MKNIILVILLLVSSSFAFSSEWVSPIDKKYKKKSSVLFKKFSEARDILSSWGGERNKLINADKLLREILTEDPKYAPAYREYGRLYIMAGYIKNQDFKKGSLSPSEKAILQSITIEPNYADSFVLLGHLYTKMRKYTEAEKALTKAEKIGTNIPWLDLNWADLLNRQGKYQKALVRYKKVIKEKTTNKKAYSRALRGITEYYEKVGDKDKIKESYLKRIEFDPMAAWTRGNYSSFLLFYYGDTDEAIKQGEKAIEIMDYGIGRFTLACALYTKWAQLSNSSSNNNKAEKYFKRAKDIYPNIEEVIKKTSKYKTTKTTSVLLSKIVSK